MKRYIILATILHFLLISCEEKETIEPTSGTFIDPRDNHEYNWVQIGDQIWMAEDLAYLPSVFPPDSLSETEPRYYVYNYFGTNISDAKLTDSYQEYGVLYNWPAATLASPSGWHLATDDDWKELEMFLGMNFGQANSFGERGIYEGGKLKETGTKHWDLPNYGATDEYGFRAIPGGAMDPKNGNFIFQGQRAAYWTASGLLDRSSTWRGIDYDHADIIRGTDNYNVGATVRCVKDK
jgi:uncharacterized protein (TIGR02145 family)